MAQVNQRSSLLDYVLKGVQVAADVYGVKQRGDQLDLQRQQGEAEQAYKNTALQQAAAKDSALLAAAREENDGKARQAAADLDYKKGRDAQSDKLAQRELGLREKQLAQNAELAKTRTSTALAAKNPADYDSKVKALNAEERKRLDSASMGYNAVLNMGKALKNGDWTFSLVGDNDYTRATSMFEEALGRMQSGGAINDEEAQRFRNMAPKSTDPEEIQLAKLRELQTDMAMRLKSLGFTAEEVMTARDSVTPPAPVTEDGLEQTAIAKSPPKGKVWVTNGKETLEIDANDLEAAKADKFHPISGASGGWK